MHILVFRCAIPPCGVPYPSSCIGHPQKISKSILTASHGSQWYPMGSYVILEQKKMSFQFVLKIFDSISMFFGGTVHHILDFWD